MHIMRIAAAVVLLVGLAWGGCGGGGGGGAVATLPDEALLSGPYHTFLVSASKNSPGWLVAAWGEFISDGKGLITSGALAVNANGTYADPTPFASGLTYFVGSDRRLAFPADGLPGVDSHRGGIGADGSVAALAAPIGAGPNAFFLLQGARGLNTASLQGSYHYVDFRRAVATLLNSSTFGIITFDGVGTATLAGAVNTEGTVTGPVNRTAAYSLAADGTLVLDYGNGDTLEGGLRPDGEVAMLGGASTTGQDPGFVILVKERSITTLDSFEGPYFWVGLEHDPLTNDYICATGGCRSDGAGIWRARYTLNDEGTITLASRSGTYGVTDNGTLILTAGTDSLRGGLSPSGDFAVLGGGSLDGTNPLLYVLIR